MDAEISATLDAIRNKEPRVYDEKARFYAPVEGAEDDKDDDAEATNKTKKKEKEKEKPMYLRDYHRENLLKGHTSRESEKVLSPLTFAQEQDQLKKTIIADIHAAADIANFSSDDGNEDDDDGGFLVPKGKVQIPPHPSGEWKIEVDVAIADKDPETFLSNFMAARAWVPSDGARFQPLESDDDEEDERAEKFEAAYNLRFEDPQGSNEMLKSYSRDVIAARSVRRDEPKGRKKQRDAEREKKEAEKREREEERARLRKLKIEEMEEKLQKIKNAAGIKGKTLKDDEWTKFLDENWDDDMWEAEMNKRFGDDYYAEEEAFSHDDSDTGEANGLKKKKKPKKPKWEDDIDIKDIVPDFEEEEDIQEKSDFSLSESESENEKDESEVSPKKAKSSRDRQEEKLAKRKAARLERKKIEDLVDSRLQLYDAIIPTKSKQPSRFRYRETSPTSFGLTALDILMAPDASLNQFAGLKKMASFRDAEKKRKDKKRLGKKARLREWRRETFGNEDGPEIVIREPSPVIVSAGNSVDIIEGRKKRKRPKKHKDHRNAAE